jgi:hypothetical protein
MRKTTFMAYKRKHRFSKVKSGRFYDENDFLDYSKSLRTKVSKVGVISRERAILAKLMALRI